MLDVRLTFLFQGTMDNVPYIELFDWLHHRQEYNVTGVVVENIYWG